MNMTPKAEALKNLDFQAFQALMGIEKKHSFPSLGAFIQYLREFNLHDILDIHSRCNCFFHEDVRPSANIYTYRGRSLYTCFAEGCPCRGKVLDLVGFYCALRGCSNAQVLQELTRFFRADFPKTASPKSRKRVLEILTKNQEIVSLLPTEAPWAYKIPGTDLTPVSNGRGKGGTAQAHTNRYSSGRELPVYRRSYGKTAAYVAVIGGVGVFRAHRPSAI